MQQNIVGFVFARGGSKGVPGKNIRPLAGKPLIAYSIESSHASRFIGRTVVSTENAEIAAVARQHRADVPFIRPEKLATDAAPEWFAWRHAINEVERVSKRPIEVFVSIPTTSPLRSVEDIDACIETLLTTDSDIVITVTESHRSPYFNMVVLDNERKAHLVLPSQNGIARRQDTPATYDMTTVAYAARRDFILTADSIFAGRVRAVYVPRERALDIDTELDFKIAEHLVCHKRSIASSQSREAA